VNASTIRLARLRDLFLVVVATLAAIVASLFVAGHVWFRALFFTAFGDRSLGIAAVAAVVAIVSGFGYVLSRPPGEPR